jgi:hypothetical protein
VGWDVWRNGGMVSEKDATYHSPGMQGLVNVIRSEGANNVIAVGGLDWAFDLRGVGQGFAISGRNLMYSCHVYPSKNPDWDSAVAPAARIAPLLIGEFGTDPTPGYAAFMTRVIGWIQERHFNGCAWCLHVGAAPCVITDWAYDRSYWDGTYVWSWLHGGPSAPSGLAANGADRAGIALTWSPVAGAHGYKVYRFAAGAERNAEAIAANLASPHFADPSGDPAKVYYYRVAALNADGESGWSEATGARAGLTGAVELPHPSFTFVSRASISEPAANRPVDVTATITNSGADVEDVLVVAGVLDAQGKSVESKEYPRQTFAHGETRSFTFAWTPNAPGAYRTGAGAFGDGYSPRYGYTLGAPLTVR